MPGPGGSGPIRSHDKISKTIMDPGYASEEMASTEEDYENLSISLQRSIRRVSREMSSISSTSIPIEVQGLYVNQLSVY